jgi:hypothetical protein
VCRPRRPRGEVNCHPDDDRTGSDGLLREIALSYHCLWIAGWCSTVFCWAAPKPAQMGRLLETFDRRRKTFGCTALLCMCLTARRASRPRRDPPGPWTPGPRPIRFFTEPTDADPSAACVARHCQCCRDEVLIETQKAAEPHLRIHTIWRMNELTWWQGVPSKTDIFYYPSVPQPLRNQHGAGSRSQSFAV